MVAIWAEVPRPEAGRRHQRGLPAPAPGAARGAAAAGADPGLAGRRLQAVRCAHRARHLRVRPRGAGEHRLPRADPGVPGALSRVPPAQDQPGEFARDRAGEPLQPRGVRDLCELAAAAAAGLRAAKVERGPGLLGRGCGALPQEWARQRALPLAGVLPAGFGAGGTGGPSGRPDLCQAAEGRPRGAACQAAVCGRRLVRQAGVRPHAGGRRRDVAGLPLEPGRHRPRGPELPRLGVAQDGGGLARGAPGQADRAVGVWTWST